MWCVLLLLPTGRQEAQLSDQLHHVNDQVGIYEEALARQAAGQLVVGVLVVQAVGLENDKLLQLRAALASPGGLSLPPSCLEQQVPLHLAPGSVGQVTAAANALPRPLLPLRAASLDATLANPSLS